MAETKKRTAKRRRAVRKSKKGLSLLGLNSIKTSQVKDLFKQGCCVLLGYVAAQLAGKAVYKIVNKEETTPEGLKKYVNAFTQVIGSVLLISMGKKNYVLRNMGTGIAVSALQETVETISGKNLLDLLSFGKETTKSVNGLGVPQKQIEFKADLPQIESVDDDDDGFDGVDDIEGVNNEDDFDGVDDIEGVDDENDFDGVDDIEGVDDEDEFDGVYDIEGVEDLE